MLEDLVWCRLTLHRFTSPPPLLLGMVQDPLLQLKNTPSNVDLVWCRLTLGLIMLGLKGVGFLCAFVWTFYSSLSAAKEFVLRYAWPYIPFLAKRPADKFADIVDRVMLQVSLPAVSSIRL